MAEKKMYEIPGIEEIDGITLSKPIFPIVFKEKIDDRRLSREKDILVATYPRTGTTWLTQIVSLMLAGEEKYEDAKKKPLIDRVLFLERTQFGSDKSEIDKLDSVPPPRADKTHLPFRMVKRWVVEDRVKTIVTTRNPKDVIVSLFHFYQTMRGYDFNGTWNEFFEHIKTERLQYGDQYKWNLDWANNKDKGEILFITYEDLKKDTMKQMKIMAKFLNLQLSDAFLERIAEDTNIKNMKTDAAVKDPDAKPDKPFVRSGQSGGWKGYFTVEQNEWFDNKYKALYEKLPIDAVYT